MGFRFRRSIKIAPGIKINIGKRGVNSANIGSFNFGSRGVHQNINIPGTGISYRYKVLGQSENVSVDSNRQQPRTTEVSFKFALDDDGALICLGANGAPLPDNIVQEIKKQKQDLILSWLQKRCEEYNSIRESLLKIHLNTPALIGEVVVNPKPELSPFEKHGFMSYLLASQKQKTEEKNKRIQQDYEKELLNWKQAEQGLRNDIEVMSAVISSAFASIEWPKETSVSFDIMDNGNILLLDVDLPEMEYMPTQKAEVNKKDLKLVVKDIPQLQIQLDYLTHIHAIGFRLIGDVFAFLPSVSVVMFSGYSQRINRKTGYCADEYLYSIRVQRKIWEQINFKNLELIDVVACFELFELRRSITKQGVISPIEPFQTELTKLDIMMQGKLEDLKIKEEQIISEIDKEKNIPLPSAVLEKLKTELNILLEEQESAFRNNGIRRGSFGILNMSFGLAGGCATFLISAVFIFFCTAIVAAFQSSFTADKAFSYMIWISTIITLVFCVGFMIFVFFKQKNLLQEISSGQSQIEEAIDKQKKLIAIEITKEAVF